MTKSLKGWLSLNDELGIYVADLGIIPLDFLVQSSIGDLSEMKATNRRTYIDALLTLVTHLEASFNTTPQDGTSEVVRSDRVKISKKNTRLAELFLNPYIDIGDQTITPRISIHSTTDNVIRQLIIDEECIATVDFKDKVLYIPPPSFLYSTKQSKYIAAILNSESAEPFKLRYKNMHEDTVL